MFGRIDSSATFYTKWEEMYKEFDQMGLHKNLLRGIYACGGFLAALTNHQSGVFHPPSQRELKRGVNELWSADALSTTSPDSLRQRHHKPSALREAVISYRMGMV